MAKTKKLVFLYRHYWPDTTPYAFMLKAMAEAMVQAGIEVTVFTAQPSYRFADHQVLPKHEVVNGVNIIRCALLPEGKRNKFLRVCNAILFPFLFATHSIRNAFLGRGYKVMWTATMPPIFQAFMTLLAAKICRAKWVYHCQDIYPEIAAYSGLIRPGMFYHLLRRIDQLSVRHCDKVIAISSDCCATLVEARNADITNIEVIPNFVMPNFECLPNSADVPQLPEGKINILFAGNIGNFQYLDAILNAMRAGESCYPNLHFTLMGEGKKKSALQTMVNLQKMNNVSFLPRVSPAIAKAVMRQADMGLVSLLPNMYKAAYPSKTITYWQESLPVWAVIENESALAKEIQANKAGVVTDQQSLINNPLNALQAVQSYAQDSILSGKKTPPVMEQQLYLSRYIELVQNMCGGV